MVEPLANELDALEGGELANLAMDAIEQAVALLGDSLEDFFPPCRASWIRSALDIRISDPLGWEFDTEFASRLLRQYDELPVEAVRPAVGPFLMALVRLFEAPPKDLSTDDAMEILSSCYESVLMSHLTGRVTLEDEESSARCISVIEQQIRIIKLRTSA